MKSTRTKSTRVRAIVLAGAMGLAGLGVGATLAPVAASAATSSATTAVGDRVTALKNALAGLVKDGTIDQSQADKVATTLDSSLPKRGPGGFGGHGFGRGAGLDDAASAIGVTADELRTQMQAGKTLAQVAATKGISQSQLVDKLVTAAKAQLAAAVKAGRITQAQADARSADLSTGITQRVTSTGPAGGRGWGGHGRGGWGGGGEGAPGGGTSSSTPGTSPSATTTS